MGARVVIIVALALAFLASPASAQVIYQVQPDGTILVTPLDGRPSWIIVPAPGTAPAYPTYGPRVPQPYYNPNSPYPPETYWQQYRRGGSAGCVYGCAGE
jgi:hypothetical protein